MWRDCVDEVITEEVAGLSGKVEGQSSCGEISRGQRFTGVKIL